MPKISIIVPVYNTEQYLSTCVDSILKQTFDDFELILVNDGSQDNCPAICDRYAQIDSRVKVIHQENEGQALARNTALDVAAGDYITFVDSDDYILENMLERLYETAVEYDADLVTCNTYRDDASGATLFYKEFSLQNRMESVEEYVVHKRHSGPCSKLYKRYIFETIRFPNLKAYEDTYIWLEILDSVDKVAHIPERLYVYNIREGSVTTSVFGSKNLAILEMSLHIQTYVRENHPELYEHVQYDYMNALYFVLFNIVASFKLKEFKMEFYDALAEMKNALVLFKNDDSPVIRKYRWTVKHPEAFKLKAYLVGFNRSFRESFK